MRSQRLLFARLLGLIVLFGAISTSVTVWHTKMAAALVISAYLPHPEAILQDTSVHVHYEAGLLPPCDVSNPEVVIIADDSQWRKEVNSAQKRIFCLEPGAYGSLTLTESGTSNNPRVIRPSRLLGSPWMLTSADQVVIQGLTIKAKHWLIDSVVFRDLPVANDSSNGHHLVQMIDNSAYITLNNILAEQGIDLVTFRGGTHHILQNSVLREPYRAHKGAIVPSTFGGRTDSQGQLLEPGDSNCIRLIAAKYVKILNNEIYNCAGDGIQSNPPNGDPPVGFLIEGNEIYVTPDLYADCDNLNPSASLTRSGYCACAENAIDIKIATPAKSQLSNLEDLNTIRNNIVYGFRRTHSTCGGTGSHGEMIILHHSGADNVLIENNTLFDSARGIMIGNEVDFVTVRNNLLTDIGDYWKLPQDGTGLGNTYYLMLGLASTSVEVYNNTFHNSKNVALTWYIVQGAKSRDIDVRNNLFLNVGSMGTISNSTFHHTVEMGYNGFFNAETRTFGLQDSTNTADADTSASFVTGSYCFTVKKHTSPDTVCVANTLPQVNSPLINKGDPAVGSRKNIGVDNQVGVATDLRGHSRSSFSEIGAFTFILPVCSPEAEGEENCSRLFLPLITR